MSDPKSSYGEPVDEPRGVDDVVGRANEGLAEAEAAGRGAVDENSSDRDADTSPDDASAAEYRAEADAADRADSAAPVTADSGTAAPNTAEPAPAPAEPDPWDSPEAASLDYSSPAPVAADAPTVVAAPVVTPSEPTVAETTVIEPAVVPAPAPQPIFVQAPEAPRPRGNRAAAGAIGLLAALSFAVLYLAARLGFDALAGDVTGADIGTWALGTLATAAFWVPVVVFFLAFWLLGAIINRGRWGAWVIFGLLVGVAAYGGHILGALFQAPFWELTASEGARLVEAELLAPLAIAAFVIGRELTIWFGAWAAARAKRVTELNIEAQREYERTLEAGPQLVRA
ncbi:ABC transporter [Microbacterium sp. M3]|uniref:ABC transporter n=1 Tax=Microbacterium arthrosphaerae TaxID=792652 RepID=A0ABU4H3F1_9MICO|nr:MULTISPECIES: ABC transporter [Microbacterium]MDW4573851.1 ABC transporter [Microbacterium arthrosphaerae]MDW7607706.1 ABC transporter [Microbacterium sp. M3]